MIKKISSLSSTSQSSENHHQERPQILTAHTPREAVQWKMRMMGMSFEGGG